MLCHATCLSHKQTSASAPQSAGLAGQGRLCAGQEVCCQRAAAGRVRDSVEAWLRGLHCIYALMCNVCISSARRAALLLSWGTLV